MVTTIDLIEVTRSLTNYRRIENYHKKELHETREIIKLIESRQKEIVRKLEEQKKC